MPLQFTFKSMESSEALEQYAKSKVEDLLEKFAPHSTQVQFTFVIENLDHIAHCHLHLDKNRDISVTASSNSMYASIDKLHDKLQQQLRKEKDKRTRHQARGVAEEVFASTPGLDEAEELEAIDADDIEKFEQVRKVLQPSDAKTAKIN